MDIVFTDASLYILFNKWEDDNVFARMVKIIKWGLVLFIWITSTIPSEFDLIRIPAQHYTVMTGYKYGKTTEICRKEEGF